MSHTSFRSRHPPDEVFGFYRDCVPDFGARLPGVARIEDVESSPTGLRIHRWIADTSRFPSILTATLPAAYFEWTTEGRWDAEARSGVWSLNIGVFGEGTHIRGRHRFVPDGVGTRVEVEGRVLIDAHTFDRLAGLPLPRMVRGVLDRLIQTVFQRVITMSGGVVERAMDATESPSFETSYAPGVADRRPSSPRDTPGGS